MASHQAWKKNPQVLIMPKGAFMSPMALTVLPSGPQLDPVCDRHTPVLGTFPIKNDFKLKILYSISNFFFF